MPVLISRDFVLADIEAASQHHLVDRKFNIAIRNVIGVALV
jgi:hypothetical protein